MKKFNDGGPEFYPCAGSCRTPKEWHRCRERFCRVPNCRESILAKHVDGVPPSLPYGKTFWCGECGGYVEYNVNIDSKYEGPW